MKTFKDLKELYLNLKSKRFKSIEQLVGYVESTDKDIIVKKLTSLDYIIYKGDKPYSCYWTSDCPIQMVIEDIMRALQILNEIKIDGVHNTMMLRDKLESEEE